MVTKFEIHLLKNINIMNNIKRILIKLKIAERELIIKYLNPVVVNTIVDIKKHFVPKSAKTLAPFPKQIINDVFLSSALAAAAYYNNFSKI